MSTPKRPPPPPPPSPLPLPEGWEEARDSKGRVYYVNAGLGKSQWERPLQPLQPLQLQDRRITFGSNGIDLENGVVLERPDLVNAAATALSSFQFLVIGAPPAYGKTSLLQLMERDFKRLGVPVVRRRLASTDPITVNNNLKKFTGIDLLEQTIDNKHPGARKVIMLDDAHEQYGLEDFWKALIKDFPTWAGGKEYVFIFSVNKWI